MLRAAQVSSVVAACLGPGEEAWLVGGAVRDGLLGRASKDLDYAVRGDAQRLARRVADLLGGAFFTYSEAFSTHRVVLSGGAVDFAPLRGPTIEQDLAGRDFTVDAMALPARGGDPGARVGVGKVIDPLGGAADLAARRLLACGPRALSADPLRVLRLARLAVEFELRPTAGLMEAAQAAAPALRTVSGERVCVELTALLGLPAAASGLRLLDQVGALAQILPEVTALHGVEQNAFHHLDVFGHTLEAVELVPQVVGQLGGERFLAAPDACGLPGAAALAPLGFVALFHDLGKPGVRRVSEDGRVMFWHHDELGAQMVRDIAARLRLSRRFQEYLAVLISTHLRLGFLVREAPLTLRALVRYRRAVEPYVFESVVLSLADRLATRGEKTSAESMARHYRLARLVWLEVPKQSRIPLLDGNEAMELLGLAPGPLLGEALQALQEETDALEVTTREEGREFLLRWKAGREGAACGEGDTAKILRVRTARAGRRRGATMPELPEVETIRRRLHPDLVGRTVLDLRVLDETVSLQSEAELRGLLVGRAVAGTARRGKWLIVDLGEVLMVVHLRMTGRLLWLPGEEERGRRPRFTVGLEGGRTLHFFDVRRFGRLWALPAARADEFFAGLGAEPLEDAFTVAHLRELLAGRRAPLKSFLTDQRRLAGVGNIYADEALFRARLHPLRPAGSVGPREARRLHAAVIETLRLGVEHEGSSVESFVDPAGSRGRFQQILNVYQRTGEPCRACATPIRRIVVGGRSTHFCPRCQPRRSMRVRPFAGGPPAGEGPHASGEPPRRSRAGTPAASDGHVSGRQTRPDDGAGPPAADAGGPAADAGRPAADAGRPAADAGRPAADAGRPAADAGRPAADAGRPAADAGRPAADAGRPAADAGGPAARLYVVAAYVPRREALAVGALGVVTLERGWYAYVGSARRGRAARVARHLRTDKPLRWHADYLFARHAASRAWLVDGASTAPPRPAECDLAAGLIAAHPRARRAVRRFGASDCGCAGHLLWFPSDAALGRAVGRSVSAGLVERAVRIGSADQLARGSR